MFHASRSYFPDLLGAGVKIYEYEKGFMHGKIVIVDYELASIGTSNMDMRSFHLNFEVNAFLYRTNSTEKLVTEYLNDLQDSREIDGANLEKDILAIGCLNLHQDSIPSFIKKTQDFQQLTLRIQPYIRANYR